jgi:hypothetical protein
MKKIKKIAAMLLILSLTAGVFTQEALAKRGRYAIDAKLRRDALIGMAGGLTSIVLFQYLGDKAASSSSKFVSRILGGACRAGTYIGMTVTFICLPIAAHAATPPRTAEQNISILYADPFILLDKKKFTDYDIDITESKYPAELIKYMEKFQAFLEFSKKEHKKNWDKTNWIYIKKQTYLKAGSPRVLKDWDPEKGYVEYMDYKDIMSDEFFYSEFLSYGYWPQFLDVFGETIVQQREILERERRQLAESAKKKLLEGFEGFKENYCQKLQKLKEGAGKDIFQYSECK